MNTEIFVNLPVKDLPKTKAFFTQLGYSFNAQFTNDDAACMIVSDKIYVMLLTEPFFKGFIKKEIADAHKTTEMLLCLSCENRAQVDDLVKKALAAGGKAPMPPQDHGFMYAHGFEDLDGHQWELCYMDPSYVQPQT